MKRRYAVLISVLALAAAALAAVGIYMKKSEDSGQKDLAEFERISAEFTRLKPEISDDSGTDETAECDLLLDLRGENSDTVAWLEIPDTDIDFPIVQTTDNNYYLSHDFSRSYSYMGCPFLDSRCSADFTDFNSIIYGHNISNEYMFYPINYFKNKNYFNEHEYGLLTLSDGVYRINFLACDVVKSDAFTYNAVFLSRKERLAFLSQLKDSAVCMRDFSDEEIADKRLVTLSTCSYEFDNARTVLVGYIDDNQ